MGGDSLVLIEYYMALVVSEENKESHRVASSWNRDSQRGFVNILESRAALSLVRDFE